MSDFLHARSDLSELPIITGGELENKTIHKTISVKSAEGVAPALWLLVLINLSVITTDQRAELRNSSIQTVQRIFENYADQLSSDAWLLCLRSVLFEMVNANLTVQKDVRSSSGQTNEKLVAWNDTTKTVLSSTSRSIAMYMDKVEDTSGLGLAWSDLLDLFEQYFDCGSHTLDASVFETITEVLSRISLPERTGIAPILKTATIWSNYFERRELWKKVPEDNQGAFIAYAEAFKAIHRLAKGSLKAGELIRMLRNLEACVIESHEDLYSSDIDHMTTLQARVMECFSSVDTKGQGLPQFLMRTLGGFATLPYSLKTERRGPTFVALSKSSMALLQDIILRHVCDRDIYTDGSLLSVFTSLEKPIREKYTWHREGKPPTIWQKATTVAIAILESTLQHINKLQGDPLQLLWARIVAITNSVTRAQLSADRPDLLKDESFDISAFAKLRSLITISLGSSSLHDALRRTYARNLFETSLLHAPASGEIPDLAGAPLRDLYKVRIGRTDDLTSSFRTVMAYACLSELFALVSHQDGDSEVREDSENLPERPARIRLAQAAAPYLILRCALPLRAYITDQPLRGRMPQPEAQRMELLYVLRELGRLESETAAIPDAEGVRSRYRKHLHRLYPLLIRAIRVGRGDDEVFAALMDLVNTVGGEFGIGGE